MKLKNGNRFRIACDEGETITYQLKSGTVEEVVTDLNGEKKPLKQGVKLRFKVTTAMPAKLTVSYPFKTDKDENYEAEVTGNAGGDTSLDQYKQPKDETSKSRRYSFDVIAN